MTYMKKFLGFLLVFFFFSNLRGNLWAFSFEIEPNIEVRRGKVGEYVFIKNSYYDQNTLSYLDWSFEPMLLAALNFSSNFEKFYISLSFQTALPMFVGTMEDSDWLNNEFQGNQDYLYKTNFSSHSNYLDYNNSFKFETGLILKADDRAVFSPFICVDWEVYQFSAMDGYGLYGIYNNGIYYPYYDEDPTHVNKLNFSGTVIRYNREQFNIYLGNKVDISLSQRFSLGGFFKIALYSKAIALDQHLFIGSKRDFLDFPQAFLNGITLEGNVNYKLNKKNKLSLKAGFVFMPPIKGINYSRNTDNNSNSDFYYNPTVEGGTDSHYYYFNISYKLIF